MGHLPLKCKLHFFFIEPGPKYSRQRLYTYVQWPLSRLYQYQEWLKWLCNVKSVTCHDESLNTRCWTAVQIMFWGSLLSQLADVCSTVRRPTVTNRPLAQQQATNNRQQIGDWSPQKVCTEITSPCHRGKICMVAALSSWWGSINAGRECVHRADV